MINLVLDFDGVINNEPFATINTFKKIFKKIKCEHTPEEAYLILKHLDEVQGNLEYNEIIINAFKEMNVKNPEKCLKLFNEFYKIEPNWNLIRMLDQYKDILNIIIFSKNSEKAIKQFLKDYNIERYFNKIYSRQKKYRIETFRDLCKTEKLNKNNTLFVGDEIYDVFIPKIMKFNFIMFDPVFSEKPLDKAILEKLYGEHYDQIINLW